MTDEPYVQCGADRLALSEVQQRAASLATGLHEAGLRYGDRVIIYMRNEITFLELNLAAGRIGAVPVPVNWHWTGDDLKHVLTNSGAKLAVGHTDLMDLLKAQAPEGMDLREVATPQVVSAAYGLGEQLLTGNHPPLADWYQLAPWAEPAPAAPMSVIYTSGTTGRAKGVIRNPIDPQVLPTTLKNIAELYHLNTGETTIIPAPLYHSAPNVYTNFAAALGMSIVIMPRFDAEEFLRLVQEHQGNTAHMVPVMFRRMLQLAPEARRVYDTRSLHSLVVAGAPCPPDLKEAMIDWLGPIVYEYYGGSEIGAWTACDSEEALARPGTVGKPILDADIRILSESGEDLPPGSDGLVYGKTFTGWPDFTYIDDDQKRRKMEIDGYLTLGDIGRCDGDGYLYLSDRLNDMVVSGGVNIYPAEIEAVLGTLQGVEDAAVFGIPDRQMGEALAAYIQVLPGDQLTPGQVKAHVADRLAKYKVPKDVVVVDQLPREDTGKLFKRKLKEQYWSKESGPV